MDAWNAFTDEIEALNASDEKNPDTDPMDWALKGLYQAFNRHVEAVWPSPEEPKRLFAPVEEGQE